MGVNIAERTFNMSAPLAPRQIDLLIRRDKTETLQLGRLIKPGPRDQWNYNFYIISKSVVYDNS